MRYVPRQKNLLEDIAPEMLTTVLYTVTEQTPYTEDFQTKILT